MYKKGEARSSFAKYLLENKEKEGLNDNDLAYIAGSIFGAGTDAVRLCHLGNPIAYNPSDRLRLP